MLSLFQCMKCCLGLNVSGTTTIKTDVNAEQTLVTVEYKSGIGVEIYCACFLILVNKRLLTQMESVSEF